MTLPALLNDEAMRRREFPITRRWIYFAHAAVSPLPRRTSAAMRRYVSAASCEGQFERLHRAAAAECRRLMAVLLGCHEDEIAFVPSTSAGLSMVAAGLNWRSGDNVIAAEADFPSNIYPWRALRRKDVELRLIPRRCSGEVTLDDVHSLVDSRTKLVALSSAHYVTGARVDLAAIGQYLKSKHILFCVDAIQTLGVSECSVTSVDFLVADAHKWLLGPQGIGVLFVRRERFDSLRPELVGWNSFESADYCPCDTLRGSARRYEPGTLNAIGIIGLHASLGLLIEVGIRDIAERVHRLRATLAEGLQKLGYSLPEQNATTGSTGIVAFKAGRLDVRSLAAHLWHHNIALSVRRDIDGEECLRAAPHFYNVDNDILRLLDAIRRYD